MRLFGARPPVVAAMGMLLLAGAALAQVKEGQPAPDVDLPATQIGKVLPGSTAKTLHLKDLQGKKNVVLYFFPKALTAG